MAEEKKAQAAKAGEKREPVVARDPNEPIGRPTPTQEENDKIRAGEMHIDEKAHDGSPSEAPPSTYATRVMKPA